MRIGHAFYSVSATRFELVSYLFVYIVAAVIVDFRRSM